MQSNSMQRKWLCYYDNDAVTEPDIIVFDTPEDAMKEAVKTLRETEYDDQNPDFPSRKAAEALLRKDGRVWLGECTIAACACEYRPRKRKRRVGKKRRYHNRNSPGLNLKKRRAIKRKWLWLIALFTFFTRILNLRTTKRN